MTGIACALEFRTNLSSTSTPTLKGLAASKGKFPLLIGQQLCELASGAFGVVTEDRLCDSGRCLEGDGHRRELVL
ncbi:hypothetical protein [Bradyrhizobium diazoefficiens]|uniref:hypothetical protein n=1 Tax=Bradyrhizobium diazoefficiens TaxID=1355477 RepID=UPI001B68BC4F|nr:hypothetical protein [Bradyrhizobium japonicum]